MNEQEYIAVVTALAAEAVRIKDNKPYYGNETVTDTETNGNSLEKNNGNSLNPAETVTDENPLPEGIFQNCYLMVFDENSLSSLFGKRWMTSITTILSLVELFKNRTSCEETTILFLPTTSHYLTDVFGNKMQVSRVIDRCKKLGLLYCVNEKFHYGDGKAYSKLYAWNKKMERLVLDFCRKRNIKADIKHSVTMERILQDFDSKANDTWKEKTDGLVVRIAQRTALPKTLTDEEVIEGVLTRYPEIRDAMETAVRLNRSLPESFQISCIPNINRAKSGTISKVGFRITNPIVSAKVHDNQNSDYHGPWLKDILKENLGSWAEYDVKSSIYRVTYLLNFGEWLPDSVDLYPKMAGFDFKTKEDRNHYKHFCMSLYFCNSAKSILANYYRKQLDMGVGRDELLKTIEEARARMLDTIGHSYRSEIFVAESCIYLEAYRRMVEEKGWRVIQVYDGFYIENGDEKTVEQARKIVEECAYWYLRKYWNGEKPVEAQEAPSAVVPVCPTEKPVERAEDPAEVKESTEEEVRARLYASNTKKMDLSRWQKQLDAWQKENGVATKPIDPTSLVDIGGKVAEAFGASFGVGQTKTWRDVSPDDLKRWNETLNPSTGSTKKSWEDVSPDCLKRWEREIQEESDIKVNRSPEETAARLELWMLDA